MLDTGDGVTIIVILKSITILSGTSSELHYTSILLVSRERTKIAKLETTFSTLQISTGLEL